ncbi:sensor histidine kinase [Haloarcula amylovorans]|uniref:sensor histidine kinase n=1 Tax=Haloarcula amylovorans TaxID=2562280 RepID=UPI0014312B5D|nr:PAS domain-containing sensor histidine kinase [Halomicroarcula amylolytica]
MTSAPVLVVVADRTDSEHLVEAIEHSSSLPSAVAESDPGAAMFAFCRRPISGLLVDATVGETKGADLGKAARRLFPDLPVVLRGSDAVPSFLEEPVAAVGSGEDVVAALTAVLDGTETAAARDPTRVETIFASLFEQFPVHLFVKDRNGEHVLANDWMIDPATVLGRADNEIRDGEETVFREAIYDDDKRVIEEGEPLNAIEEYSSTYDRHLLTSKVPWYDADGAVSGLVGLCQDITERRRREQRLRNTNERARKIALKTAHELRNELQIATGRLELADADDPYLDDVADSHARLLQSVNEVVRLATQQPHDRDREEHRLSAVARETWRALTRETHSLTIRADSLFVADPDGIRLLFESLYKNAREHAGEGVTVVVGATDDGFFVADDGPGINVEPQARVFQAGFTTCPGNSGFGLYIARSIAEEHRWSLSVGESETGGARFDIRGVESQRTAD